MAGVKLAVNSLITNIRKVCAYNGDRQTAELGWIAGGPIGRLPPRSCHRSLTQTPREGGCQQQG